MDCREWTSAYTSQWFDAETAYNSFMCCFSGLVKYARRAEPESRYDYLESWRTLTRWCSPLRSTPTTGAWPPPSPSPSTFTPLQRWACQLFNYQDTTRYIRHGPWVSIAVIQLPVHCAKNNQHSHSTRGGHSNYLTTLEYTVPKIRGGHSNYSTIQYTLCQK